MENPKGKSRSTDFKPIPEIVEINTKKIVYNSIIGEYSGDMDYAGGWNKVCGYAGPLGLLNGQNEFLSIYYDDPDVTPAGKQRCDIAITVDRPIENQGEIVYGELNGGKYAKFTYQGPYNYLSEVWDAIYSEWLPQSECELRMSPGYEKYINSPDSVSPENLITELYIPIK